MADPCGDIESRLYSRETVSSSSQGLFERTEMMVVVALRTGREDRRSEDWSDDGWIDSCGWQISIADTYIQSYSSQSSAGYSRNGKYLTYTNCD
jgi:hypothetical protein